MNGNAEFNYSLLQLRQRMLEAGAIDDAELLRRAIVRLEKAQNRVTRLESAIGAIRNQISAIGD